MIGIVGSSLSAYAVGNYLDSINIDYKIISVDKEFSKHEIYPPINYGINTIDSATPEGCSAVWHGVVAVPDMHEIASIAGNRPHIEVCDILFCLNLLNAPEKLVDDVLSRKVMRTYFTPFKPLSTREWLKANSHRVLYDPVITVKKNNEEVYVTHKSGKSTSYSHLFICAGPLQTFSIIANSAAKKDSISYFSDHAAFPIGSISYDEFKEKLATIFQHHEYANNGHQKIGIHLNLDAGRKFSIFLRPSLNANLNIKEERSRLFILDYRSGKVGIAKLFQALLNYDTLIKLAYLKLGSRLGWNTKPKYYEFYVVTPQLRNSLSRKIMMQNGQVKIDWDFEYAEIKNYKRAFLNYLKENDVDLNFVEIYDDTDLNSVITGTSHIAGTGINFLNQDSYELSFCEGAYLCGASTFLNPIVPNNTLTSMAHSVSVVRSIFKTNE